MKELVKIFLPIFLIFNAVILRAQLTTIEGRVREEGTKESIPFAHVFVKGLQVGITTDTAGYYKLQFDLKGKKADSVTFSFMGYHTQRVLFKAGVQQTIDVYLKSQFTGLGDVVFKAEENPAWAILDKIIANRDKNNPDKKDSYYFEEYSKIRFDLNNFTEKIKKNFLVRPFEFLWNDVDTTADGVPFLPVLLVEKNINHFYQSSPQRKREIVTGINTTGLRGPQIMRFVDDLYLSPNVYDDFVVMLDKNFPSPITPSYKLFYDHYLLDSTEVNNRKQYRIMFEPKHKHGLAFTGEMLVDAMTYAIKNIELRFDITANVNFIRSYWVSQKYDLVDKHWMLVETQVLGDFTVIENNAEMTGFFGRKNSLYKNISVNTPLPSKAFKGSEIVVEADSARLHDSVYWQKNRPINLTHHEAGVFNMVKKVEADPAFKLRKNLVLAFVSGYVPFKQLDIGNFYSLYSYNVVEHSRMKIGFKTGKNFKSPLRFSVYGAYGTYDEKWKYGLSADWNFTYRKKNATRIGFEHKYDIEQLGRSFNQIGIDHILSTFVQIGAVKSRNYVTNTSVFLESNVTTGLLLRASYFNNQIQRTRNDYFTSIENGLAIPTKKFNASGYSFLLKFSYQNKNISGKYYANDDGVKLAYRKYPDIAMEFRQADKNLCSDLNFTKLNIQFKQNVRMRSLGYWQYFIDAGKTWGTVPYPYLNIPFGNQLVFQDDYTFNLMNFLEYVSDQYATVYLQHHHSGLLFDRIPLINKLKWRTLTFARGYWGSLSDKNNQQLYLFPEKVTAINNHYYEVGFGIENIFKIARVDFTWRLTDTHKPDVYYFIVKPSFRFSF